MKQLTCEMCGSTDMMKQDGVFVCQTCGCKYSVEEARKMMVEGTVEVQGTVQVANTAQISNLLTMAHNSFDSKNYAKAEEFCNQVIAMDDQNYEAWKLKGEAINYQISAKNPRILEVYNCIMTSYRILPADMEESERESKKMEITEALKICMEGEVDFWLDQFEAGRPTEAALKKVKSTYVDCYNKMKAAYEEMGYESETYLKNFDNHFCAKSNKIAVSAWKTTVAYNFFREDLDNLGRHWNRNNNKIERGTDYFRPTKEIWTTFMDEGLNLITLLEYCEKQFNDLTPLETKENIYSNIAYFCEVPIDQWAYKAMVHTTTNGYGAVTDQYEYYQPYWNLTDDAQRQRKQLAQKYEFKEKMVKAEREGREQAKRSMRIVEYWSKHAEEKAALESEKQDLESKINARKKEIEELPGRKEIEALQERIDSLNAEKAAIGFFKFKDKQAKQEEIDAVETDKKKAEERVNAEEAVIQEEIGAAQKRIREIDAEFKKDR